MVSAFHLEEEEKAMALVVAVVVVEVLVSLGQSHLYPPSAESKTSQPEKSIWEGCWRGCWRKVNCIWNVYFPTLFFIAQKRKRRHLARQEKIFLSKFKSLSNYYMIKTFFNEFLIVKIIKNSDYFVLTGSKWKCARKERGNNSCARK